MSQMKPVEQDAVMKLMQGVLDIAARRQAATAANLVNSETPGYRTVDFDFASALRLAAGGASAPEVEAATRARPVGSLRVGNDGNDVDLDREMLNLARSSGTYGAAVEILRRQIALLRYALSDGRD